MNLFFWQNCISPHQVPYIRKIKNDPRVDNVYLISPFIDSDERKNMGWSSADYAKQRDLDVYIEPTRSKIDELMRIDPEKSVHLFSGIRGDKNVFQYFLQSLEHNLKRGFIIEPPFTYNKPLWAHYVRFFIQDSKYIGCFDYVFAIGEDSVKYYTNISKRWKVIPFVYCTETPQLMVPSDKVNDKPLSIVYVGSLSCRKNVMVLLKALKRNEELDITLDIYGDGDQRRILEKYARQLQCGNRITFHGSVPMSCVTEIMQRYDILVLPSLYDGWGAVVNEALMCGLYVICSSRCGARMLLKSPVNGAVFKNNDSADLALLLRNAQKNIEKIRNERFDRVRWSECITGDVVSRYMIDNLCNDNKQTQPWAK